MEHNSNYEQMTVPTLKNLARERGITRYSRLRKSELIKKFRKPILDRGISARMANVPFLTPTPYVPHKQLQHQHHHPLQTLLKI